MDCIYFSFQFRAQLSTLKQKNLESIRHGRKQVDPSNIGLFEFEVAQDFIGSEFVDEYLEMYSELTVIAPSKYYNTLNEELTTRRRAEFVSASDMGEGRQVRIITCSIQSIFRFFSDFKVHPAPCRNHS